MQEHFELDCSSFDFNDVWSTHLNSMMAIIPGFN